MADLENKMINASIKYIERIIDYSKPKKGVYIAIDGVAPLAKVKQQRYRRFKSVQDKVLFDNIKRKHNKEIKKKWNNSAITPGTIFMEKLHFKILKYLNSKNDGLEYIYSSCKSPGEGEHKLLQFIRQKQENKEHYSYIIYGLDADLIYLALASNQNDIFLLREAQQFNKRSTEEFNYVSIDIMRKAIFENIKKIVEEKGYVVKIESLEDKFINDFIFLGYLLGNDFLPHLPSLDIYNRGLDTILDHYIEVMGENKFKSFLINRGKKTNINLGLFKDLIESLALIEEDTLKQNYVNVKKNKRCFSSDPYEIEMFRIDNLYFKIEDPIELGKDNSKDWKSRYYKHYFEEDNKDIIDNLVYEYLKGLKWVTKYYFDSCPSVEWFYPYDQPPFLEDIYKYLLESEFKFSKIRFKYGQNLKPINQLLMILPPQSAYLLPEPMKKLILEQSSISHLYPKNFKLDYLYKHKYFMCLPILPKFEIELVKKEYKKNESKLKDNEHRRNKRLKDFYFNKKIV
jgi:5'-3' exonuclease